MKRSKKVKGSTKLSQAQLKALAMGRNIRQARLRRIKKENLKVKG